MASAASCCADFCRAGGFGGAGGGGADAPIPINPGGGGGGGGGGAEGPAEAGGGAVGVPIPMRPGGGGGGPVGGAVARGGRGGGGGPAPIPMRPGGGGGGGGGGPEVAAAEGAPVGVGGGGPAPIPMRPGGGGGGGGGGPEDAFARDAAGGGGPAPIPINPGGGGGGGGGGPPGTDVKTGNDCTSKPDAASPLMTWLSSANGDLEPSDDLGVLDVGERVSPRSSLPGASAARRDPPDRAELGDLTGDDDGDGSFRGGVRGCDFDTFVRTVSFGDALVRPPPTASLPAPLPAFLGVPSGRLARYAPRGEGG